MRIYDVIIVFRQVLDNKLYNRIMRDEINAYQWQREMGEGVSSGRCWCELLQESINKLYNYHIGYKEWKVEERKVERVGGVT